MISRRTFIISGYSFVFGMGAMYLYEKYRPKNKEKAIKLDFKLKDQQFIADYYSPFFYSAYKTYSENNLMKTLEQNKVIINKHGLLDLQMLENLSKTDELIEYRSKLYTKNELMLYALAYKTYSKERTITLENVDFVGGDMAGFKTSGSYTDCLEACIKDKDCKGFTFATKEHPLAQKRGYCWLKKEGFEFKSTEHYISGVVKH